MGMDHYGRGVAVAGARASEYSPQLFPASCLASTADQHWDRAQRHDLSRLTAKQQARNAAAPV